MAPPPHANRASAASSHWARRALRLIFRGLTAPPSVLPVVPKCPLNCESMEEKAALCSDVLIRVFLGSGKFRELCSGVAASQGCS